MFYTSIYVHGKPQIQNGGYTQHETPTSHNSSLGGIYQHIQVILKPQDLHVKAQIIIVARSMVDTKCTTVKHTVL